MAAMTSATLASRAADAATQRTVTVVMAVIAALAFIFSFGNVWALALRLGVPRPIAPLIAPMVDLSVVGLLVGLRYLALRGVPADQLKAATRLMHLSGLLTLGLNIAEPLAGGHYGRAALDAVAPVLLLGWGTVGPQLLRHFHAVAVTAPEQAPSQTAHAPVSTATLAAPVPVPDASNTKHSAVPDALLNAAREIAAAHHTQHGHPITPAQLRTRLGIAPSLANTIHAQLT